MKFTIEEIEEALLKTGGVQSHAAAVLAYASGKSCSRELICLAIHRTPRLQEAQQRARERTLDLAESKLIERIRDGDTNAIKFLLETLGKHRGFTRKVEVAGSFDVNVTDQKIQDAKDELARKYERLAIANAANGGGPSASIH